MKILKIISFLLLNFFLTSSASELSVDTALEQSIRDIFTQVGITIPLLIQDTGPEFQSFAFVSFQVGTADGSKIVLYINQEKFKLLSPEEQRFIILHEIEHVKTNVLKNLGYVILPTALGICMAMPLFMSGIMQPLTVGWKHILLALCCGYGTKKICDIIVAKLMRDEEFAADAFAFKIQKNVEVARSVFEKRKHLFEEQDSHWLWQRLLKEHPSSDERIAAIESLPL